jgi:orotidine-5'-phosphate decarboxylase
MASFLLHIPYFSLPGSGSLQTGIMARVPDPQPLKEGHVTAKDRIIVALDVNTADDAVSLAKRLADHVGAFKVGLELVDAAGFDVFTRLKDVGVKHIFYDAKFHDIPNTVAGAARAAVKHGLWMINVHASGGSRMVQAASDGLKTAAGELGVQTPILLGVTVLTSVSQEELNDQLRVAGTVGEQVAHLAQLTQDSGGTGVIASPLEIEIVRETCGPDFLIVTPGVRPATADAGDQRRTMTPGEAVKRGADYLVIGRPITGAADQVAAAEQIVAEINSSRLQI